ncbi:MAG: hypothetical protein AB8D78_00465 [Akkermansiaceae bacterium]
MKFALSVFVFFCLLTVSSKAQQPTVNLSFVSFPRAFSVEPVELLVGPEKTIEIQMPAHTVSAPVRVPQLSRWQLGKSGVDEDGNFVFKVFGSVEGSSSKSQTLVVFRSKNRTESSFKVLRLDGDANGFAGGSQFFYNATKVPIGASVGDRKFSIEPGKYKLTKAKASYKRNGREYLGVEFFYQVKDRQEKFESTTWRHNDKVRYMVFFYHDDRTKQITTHLLRTYPKPPR